MKMNTKTFNTENRCYCAFLDCLRSPSALVAKLGTMGDGYGPNISFSAVIPEFHWGLVRYWITAACSPVNTTSVEKPPFCPNWISVFNRSPTIMVRDGSKLTLNEGLSVVFKQSWSGNWADLDRMQSSMTLDGLPVHTGFLFNAYRKGANSDPAPGRILPVDGKVLSSLVTTKWQSEFVRR